MNPEIYKQFIASRIVDDKEKAGEEVDTLPAGEQEKVGWSVFHSDENGLFLFDYKIRGFFKEAASAVTGKAGLAAFKSKIDKWLFVAPRKLYLRRSGSPITKPDSVLERPIRAMTAQGPRVSLKRSDLVIAGTEVKCNLILLSLGEREITEKILREWLDYGQFQGLGEWRNGSNGRFTFELHASNVLTASA